MKRFDFERLLNQMQAREKDPVMGVFEEGSLALLTTYVNKQGDRSKNMFLRNIQYPCSFPGCFEADCFSHFLNEELYEAIGDLNKDHAATSRRVFSIARVETAEIICL